MENQEQKNGVYDLYEVTVSSSEIATVWEYLNWQDSPAKCQYYRDNPENFLEVTDGIKTNRERIEGVYKTKEDIAKKGSPTRELPLRVGTKLLIPAERVQRSALLSEVNNVISVNDLFFKASQLARLEADLSYTPVTKSELYKNSAVKDVVPGLSVWVWCRALSEGTGTELTGRVIDITGFVQNINVSVGKNGGSFTITLPPISATPSSNTAKNRETRQVEWDFSRIPMIVSSDGSFVVDDSIYQTQDNEAARNRYLFHNILSSNDIVFIRHEALEMEATQRIDDARLFDVPFSSLAGRIYDMIGLIDNSSLSVNPESNNVTINIQGRDLSKIFIDDGSYFFPLELAQGHLRLLSESQAKSPLAKRLLSNGALQYLNLYYNTSIEKIFKFVIAQLSNLKIAPDIVFDSWRNRMTQDAQAPMIQPIDAIIDAQKKTLQDLLVERRKELVASPNVDQEWEDILISSSTRIMSEFILQIKTKAKPIYSVVDETATIESWSAFEFDTPLNIVPQQIPENGFPEGIEYYFKPSTTQYPEFTNKLIAEAFKLSVLEVSRPKHMLIQRPEPLSGIWSLVRFVIDEQVAFRRLVDASISSANGSLLNFFKKACQEPFVELLMDTYGDEYVLVARKPPYDGASILRYTQGLEIATEVGLSKGLIIDIEDVDLINNKLSFDEENIYSWYHFTPQAQFFGSAGQYSLYYLPAILLPEYADIWGSKPYQITHNYLNYTPTDPQANSTLSNVEKQAFVDYKYVIDCHSYLPFTRKGTITINRDRRMKVGSMVYLKATGEIFFVDSVQHSTSITNNRIDAITTLNVSRGMIRLYLTPQVIEGISKPVSYFNIVEVTLNLNATKQVPKQKIVYEEVTETISVPGEPIEVTTEQEVQTLANTTSFLSFRIPSDRSRMNKNLLNDLEFAAKKMNKKLYIGTAITGHKRLTKSGNVSRHVGGLAVDIPAIDGFSYNNNRAQFIILGNILFGILREMGYVKREDGDNKSVLWQVAGHYDHLHVSRDDFQSLTTVMSSIKYQPTTKTIKKTIEKKVDDGFQTVLDRDKILQVSVNTDVLNFFLKKRQMLTTI